VKKLWAFIVALFVFGLVGLSMRVVAPLVAGIVITIFNLSPIDAQDIKTLESVGNIFNLIFSGYVATKVFKKMTKAKE